MQCLYFFLNEKNFDDFTDYSIEFQSFATENWMLKIP